jgi:hypothetical protein
MKEVTEEEFCNFLKNIKHKKQQGMCTHSEDYIDLETNKIIAYRETSSYSPNIIYKILMEIESSNHYCESSGEKCNQQCKFCKNE